MKKLLGFIMAVLLGATLLVGCGAEEEVLTYEEQFLNTLVEALEARWEKHDQIDLGEVPVSGERERLRLLIDAEREVLDQFEGELEDERLQELKESYLEGLNMTEESTQYIGVDDMRYFDMFDEGSAIRAVALIAIVEEYDLELDEEYLESIRVTARLAEEARELNEAVASMMADVEFELVEDNGFGMRDFEAVIENTTGVDFSLFFIDISLIDADGVVVDTTMTSTSNWEAGQRVRFDFLAFEEFERMEIDYDFHLD